jgi:drug/metabolite transporter (DMT)-like permease
MVSLAATWAGLSEHAKGLLITATGVMILTPDALLLKLITAEPWTILVWRGLGFFLVIGLFSLVRHKGALWHVVRATGVIGLLITGLHSLGQLLFVFSIHNTTAANTLVIIAAAPLAAALMARLILGERTARRTLVVGVVALAAVALTVQGGIQAGGIWGDLAAVGVMLNLALVFVLLRKAKGRDMLPALAWGGLLTCGIALAMAPMVAFGGADRLFLPLLVLVVVPLSFILISTGPRYIPAPEVGLLMLLETIFGPLWVWLVLAETPATASLVGGAVIVLTLATNAWLGLKEQRRLRAGLAAA